MANFRDRFVSVGLFSSVLRGVCFSDQLFHLINDISKAGITEAIEMIEFPEQDPF